MKRALLILFLASVALPCLSQQKTTGREKKHTPVSSIFRMKPENILMEREKSSKEKFAETIEIRNNARADSILVSGVAFPDKDFGWHVEVKEIPVYHEGTTLVKELERWYSEGPDKAFTPFEKILTEYDDHERITWIERHYFHDGEWHPSDAEETVYDEIFGELSYAWYIYDETLGDWVMEEGYRAVDEHNENGALVQRIWEYYYMYYMDEWLPDNKEEYILNEDDVMVEIIGSYYEEWDKTWEYEFRMKYELDENNMWVSGYGYIWDWMNEEWLPEFKYIDIQWFNFDHYQYTTLTALVNAEIWDDWDDFGKGSEEDVDWLNYMRVSFEYTNDGLITSLLAEFWMDEDEDETADWVPGMREEIEYDHFNNMVYMAFSVYDYFELEEWILIYGFKYFMDYNDDLSIDSYELFLISDNYWKVEYDPIMRSQYFYSEDDDPTNTIPVEAPKPLVSVFPNPASSLLNVSWEGNEQALAISIIGIDGKTIANHGVVQAYPGQPITLDVSGLKKGVYFIQVSTSDTRQATRFIKS